ncbi:MAG: sugar-transfer associated ATP-grasp domain-containing protein [Paracoccaceae bacterium]
MEARTFIGAYGAAQLALRINRNSNRRGMVGDKLLFGATLRGAGLPAPELRAVFGRPAPHAAEALSTIDDLRQLLRSQDCLPLFGKPLLGQRAGGEIAVFGFDDRSDQILTVDGDQIPIVRFWERLERKHRSGGYLFQSFLRQHPSLVRMVGPIVATVRVITLFDRKQALIHRSFWKVPLGEGYTDHPRAGHAAAIVDAETGIVGPVLADVIGDRHALTRHPMTGCDMFQPLLPHWEEVCEIAKQAAGLFPMVPLIGWDIAICTDGPVIVEANTSPSLDVPQYLSGQGALSGPHGETLVKLARQSARVRRNARREKRRRRLRLITGRLV